MLFCGIDVHKRTIAVRTVDAVGALVSNAAFLTRREAVTAYVTTLDGPQQAVCECTSMWYGLRDLLVSQGIDQRLAHAKYLKAINEAKVKTDAVCAATMGDGNRYLKMAFDHAAIRAIQYVPEVKTEFQRCARRKARPLP